MTQTETSYIAYLQKILATYKIDFVNESQFYLERKRIKTQERQKQHQSISKESFQSNLTQQLTGDLVERYCRQMLLKQIGFVGQQKIIRTKVALIGSGGIGCPVAIYLAGAGVGHIGLFDSDTVDMSNLHRQIGHKDGSVGKRKTQSLKSTLLAFNPNLQIKQHEFITVKTANELNQYDLIIDGSDNPECRYIVNDHCMKENKKLLSGACIGWEGQITCYGGQGPCYRCIWGDEQKTSGGCSTLGVVGMLPGLVGIILATEAIKMIINGQSSLQGYLLTYESKKANFRKMKLRGKKPDCIGCGQAKLNMENYDYSKHAICKPDLSNLPKVQQISWEDLLKEKNKKFKILDVRPQNQFGIVNLRNMVNVPYQKLSKLQKDQFQKIANDLYNQNAPIYVSCNRGVMSKRAVDILRKWEINAVSVKGGITEYSNAVDSRIPKL